MEELANAAPEQQTDKVKIVITRRRGGRGDRVFRFLCYVFTIFSVIVGLFPLYWLLVSSTKDALTASANPPIMTPVLPTKWSVGLDTGGVADYTQDDFEYESAVLLWMTCDRNIPVSALSYSTLWVEDGAVRGRATLTVAKYQSQYAKDLFVGRVTQRVMTGWRDSGSDKYGRLLSHISFAYYGTAQALPAASADEKAAQINQFYSDAQGFSGDFQSFETFSLRAHVGSVVGEKSFWGLFDVYSRAWNSVGTFQHSILHYALNSLVVATVAALLKILVAGGAGYALSKLIKKRWKNAYTMFLIIPLLIPGVIEQVPLYTLFLRMGLKNTFTAIWLPGLADSFTPILFRGFFDALPKDLREAGKVDGATEFGIYFKLILPLSVPVFVYIAISAFVGSWDNFMWPFMILGADSKLTLPLIIHRSMAMVSGARKDYAVTMAISVLTMLPLLPLFLINQKFVSRGLVFSGIKG